MQIIFPLRREIDFFSLSPKLSNNDFSYERDNFVLEQQAVRASLKEYPLRSRLIVSAPYRFLPLPLISSTRLPQYLQFQHEWKDPTTSPCHSANVMVHDRTQNTVLMRALIGLHPKVVLMERVMNRFGSV